MTRWSTALPTARLCMMATALPPSLRPAKPIANKALKLIKVDYEVLPHVTDVEEACKDDAPLLHDNIFTDGLEETPTKPSNISGRVQFGHGDVEEGFAAADTIVERKFRTEATHQGYIEPHACVGQPQRGRHQVNCGAARKAISCRPQLAARPSLGLDISRLRVTASEIGGGFRRQNHNLHRTHCTCTVSARPAGR